MKIQITCEPVIGINATGYTASAHRSTDGDDWEPVPNSEGRPLESTHTSKDRACVLLLEALEAKGITRENHEFVD